MKNSQLKRKLLYALNQELLSLMRDVKEEQIRLLIALNDEIKCVLKKEDDPRLQIARMDYQRALKRYIDTYTCMFEKQQEISTLSAWEYRD